MVLIAIKKALLSYPKEELGIMIPSVYNNLFELETIFLK